MVLRSRQFRSRFPRRLICVAALGACVGAASLAQSAPASPIVKGPYLQDLEPTSVVVRAEVSPPAAAVLEVREAGSDAGKPLVFEDRAAESFHSIRATGLRPKTNYNYVLRSGGVSQIGKLTTAPPEDSKDSFSFLLYGDNRTDEVGHAAVVRAMSAAPSDFLLHTGDFVQDGSNAGDWQLFFDIEAPLLRDRAVFACIGNHELIDSDGTAYLRYFGPTSSSEKGNDGKPKLYGSFRWGNTRFFLLNAMDQWDSGPERAWLEGELARADDEPGLVWRVAVLHHAPWSAGPHGGNPRVLRALIPQLLAKHKVDVVFAGHDHIYERGFADGMRYVISGGGGAPLYRVSAPLASTRKVESVRHFVDVSVTPESFALVAKRDDGTLLDECRFTKASTSWDCDPRPPVSIAQPASVATPVPETKASRCACRAPGAVETSAGALLATMLAAIAIVARRRAR